MTLILWRHLPTAEAFGIHHIIYPKIGCAIMPAVVKSSAGAAENKITQLANLRQALDRLKNLVTGFMGHLRMLVNQSKKSNLITYGIGLWLRRNGNFTWSK